MTAKTLQVQINGESHELPDKINLSELVKDLSLAPERVAIELNRRVVRRAEWAQTILAEGDRIEIVHFVGGGECVRQYAGDRSQEFIADFGFSVYGCKVVVD